MMRLVRVLFALLLFWCGFTEATQWFSLLFFRMWVAGDWFLILLASDAAEAKQFIWLNPIPITVSVVICSIGIGVGIWSLKMSRRAWWITVGVFLLYAAAGINWLGRAWTPAYLAYDTIRGIRDYVTLVSAGRWTNEDEEVAKAAALDPKTKELPTVILVIGESLTTSRMGIYGYAKDTTPELSTYVTNGLVVLPPQRAFGSYTAKALQGLLVPNGESLVRKLRRQGYCPILLSAQGHWERYCGVELMVYAACEKKRYLREEFHKKHIQDWKLVDWVESELESTDRPLFLIVHLIGSHYPFADRIPKDWSASDGMDAYDLSVRITDMIVVDLIKLLPQNGVLIFTSDHGETPDSPSWRNAQDPALWSVPYLIYPKDKEAFARKLLPY